MNNNLKQIFFRVDANITLGRGHMSRSLALARMLKEQFKIIFISLENCRDYCSNITHEFPHIFISAEIEIDKHLTVNDILVLDGYQFNELQITKLKTHVRNIAVIHDFGSVPSYADLIINQTPGIVPEDYIGCINVRLCLGLDYCLVSPELIGLRKKLVREKNTNGLLVCFGGADPLSLCEKFVKELLEQGFKHQIVAVGRLSKPLTEYSNVLHVQTIDPIGLAHLMIGSRVTLLSSSVVAFEAATLGCAIFAIWYTENQAANYRGLTEMGLAEGGGYIGSNSEVTHSVKKLISLYNDANNIEILRNRTFSKIDGQSNKRILSAFNSLVNRE
jgi:UDP-2,4-diacetamido-2,4,6-trideoxy-beta-L-altropyranose hydrolase